MTNYNKRLYEILSNLYNSAWIEGEGDDKKYFPDLVEVVKRKPKNGVSDGGNKERKR